ncbi:ATP-dependent DNA helicase [Trichonephila inaurata madagascariensis]|uniref:ATP-dependent DNA helicase n=1 Tax=Trichonephila inaurata madagascariensis TaxID=2747483 RepID=A0A8X7BRJ3_9ARAC|nr:ATP-dependent DNA helicase [Trichonephila inaurata madagascariensis]
MVKIISVPHASNGEFRSHLFVLYGRGWLRKTTPRLDGLSSRLEGPQEPALGRVTSQVPQDEIRENITIQESLTAQQQTLLWNEEKYLRIVPGEASVPRSLLFYEHAEELSFPTIYLGHFRNFREGVRVTPFMIATSELRRVDRRGVTPQHLLYMAMKIMRLRK